MKASFYSLLVVGVGAWFSAAGAEVSFQSVAIINQSAPGLSNNVHFSGFNDVSLADDGRIAFTANISGPGVSSTNNLGLWAGWAGDLNLQVQTGDPVPGTNGETFTYLDSPNIDNHGTVGFLAKASKESPADKRRRLYEARVEERLRQRKLFRAEIGSLAFLTPRYYSFNGHVIDAVAGVAELSGPGIGPTNNIAIVAGPPTNAAIVARIGFPAPGVTGNFTEISDAAGAVALMPSGKVAFMGSTTADSGVWMGDGDDVVGVALYGRPAPVSLLGAGNTFGFQRGENLEVNGRGELAFSTFLNGPGLNDTNSEFVVAGTPSNLRVIVQSGQPAPGIAGAFFQPFYQLGSAFSHVLLGADGAVVFVGCYSTTGTNFGLWLAPTNGATPLLLMRDGQQAPGTPAGVVFNDATAVYAPPIRQAFMNSRNQVVFRARLGGPGIGNFSFGIWLAESDGTVNLIARSGDMIDTGDGTVRQLDNVTFGVDPVFMAGPEDGRSSPFNDRGEIALLAYFTDTTGVVIAHTGLNIKAERVGNDILIRVPTLTNKTYRVDYATNLPTVFRPVLKDSIMGTGGEVTVTDTNAISVGSRFYRAVRLD